MTRPMVWARGLVEVCREATYGEDPGTPAPFLATQQADEMVAWRTTQIERSVATSRYGGGGTRLVGPYGEMNPLRTQLWATGNDDWVKLLEASGFRSVSDTTWEASPTLFHTSLSVRRWTDGILYRLTGVHCALALRAVAGGPIAVEASLSGQMVEEEGTPPRYTLVRPEAATFCGADFQVTVDGRAVRRPRGLQEITIETGTVLGQRTPASSSGRTRWRVQNVVPLFRCNIEDQPDVRWLADRNRLADIGITVGRWRWELASMQLAAPPEPLRLSSGLAGVGLVFRQVANQSKPCSVRRLDS